MDGHLSDEHIRLALAGVQVAVISSSKIPRLTRSVFELAPDSTMLSYNPGSSEFSPGSDVLPLMQDRQPDLFTANEEELRALFADADTRIEDITLLVAKYARTVICTLGKAGLLLAHNGQVSRQECTDIPKKRIKDTLGAGDRVHAVAIYRHLIRGDDPRVVLQEIDNGATQVVQRIGAHGDLYSQVQPVTFSLK
jgi:sugar/nucleoside kinase (ribokinase family)